MSFNHLDFIYSKENELHEHLINDFNLRNANDRTLHIIDNYNVKTLSDRNTINFYNDSFRDTYIEQIIFYHQVNLDEDDLNEIRDLSRRLDLNFEELISFVSIFHSKSISRNKGIIKELDLLAHRQKYPWNHFKSTKDFMSSFERININVKIHPYKAFSKNYIHGRYWININPNVQKGYLVDGSLNSYPNALIIAQSMDEENYSIIHSVLTHILNEKSADFIELGINHLDRIYNKICDYFRN